MGARGIGPHVEAHHHLLAREDAFFRPVLIDDLVFQLLAVVHRLNILDRGMDNAFIEGLALRITCTQCPNRGVPFRGAEAIERLAKQTVTMNAARFDPAVFDTDSDPADIGMVPADLDIVIPMGQVPMRQHFVVIANAADGDAGLAQLPNDRDPEGDPGGGAGWQGVKRIVAVLHVTAPLLQRRQASKPFTPLSVTRLSGLPRCDHGVNAPKGTFRATNDGRMYAGQSGALFDKLVPFFLLAMDHAAYSRTGEEAPGNWDTWLNVMNVEIENGLSERELYGLFYGEGPNWENDGWRQIGAFSSCVLKPLEWAGFITSQETHEPDGRLAHMIFKTPLWRAVLKLETDRHVRPMVRH